MANGMVIYNSQCIFCHSITCSGTNQCWNRDHICQSAFMNVNQYASVRAQVQFFAVCSKLQTTSNVFRPKKKSTSHIEQLGWL